MFSKDDKFSWRALQIRHSSFFFSENCRACKLNLPSSCQYKLPSAATSTPTIIALHPGGALPALLIPTPPAHLFAAVPPPVHAADALSSTTTTVITTAAVTPPTAVAATTAAPPPTPPSATVSVPARNTASTAVAPCLTVTAGHATASSSSAVISDLAIHDNVIRKRSVHSERVVSAAKLRRSARIADREAPFYSTMSQKASRLKAARFNLSKASDDLTAAVQGSSLCVSDGEASDADDAADKLA